MVSLRSHIAALFTLLTLAVWGQSPGGIVGGSGDPFSGKRWGLADAQGNLVVPFQFTSLQSSENDALVAKNSDGHYRVLASNGHAVSAFEYEYAAPSPSGTIVVIKNGLRGAYDHSGKLLIPPIYQGINEMRNDLIPIEKAGAWGWIDLRNGRSEFLDQKFQGARALDEDLIVGIKSDGKGMTGFHRNGQVRFQMSEGDNAYPISDTVFRVLNGTKWEYFDFDGKACPAPPLSVLSPFWDHGQWGYKATDGSVIITPHYDVAYPFKDGFAIVHKGRFQGLIKKDGNWAIPLVCSVMGPGADGGYVFCKDSNSDGWAEVNTSGHRSALAGKYCQVLPRLTSGLFPVREP